MSRSRRLRPALPLALAAALGASGCIGILRRSMAPEERVTDAAAARSCALEVTSRLGYVPAEDRGAAPEDSARGRSRLIAERRGGTPEGGTVIDQLAITVEAGDGTDAPARLRVVPARFAEDPQTAMATGRAVPRMRPPGPSEGASRLEGDGVRRRRVSARVPRRDAAEVVSYCGR